ncbi:MAG: GNAT family N-acetyltransferase, partial [Paracoccaceae bacterium]
MDSIRTERLFWRPPLASDIDGYMAFVSDYEVVKWTSSWPHPADREFVARRCVPLAPGKGFAGPVFLGDEQIGGIGLVEGELGYFIARRHWGRGYATEIARAIISRAFARFGRDQITASVIVGNPGSARVLQKLGFRQTRPSRCGSVAQGGEFDAVDYRLSRNAWLTANPLLIETKRMTIRAFDPDDVAPFHAIARQQRVSRMLQSVAHPLSLAGAADWIDSRRYAGRPGFCAGV